MRDVARLAGVSQSTVSLVVNEDQRVSDDTRERVGKAIEQLGFRANKAARSLRGVSSQTLGFVTNQMATSPFAGQTILGAQEVAWADGHILLVVDAGDSQELAESAIRVLIDQDISGIIYAPMSAQSVTVPAALGHVPSIIVNGYPADASDFPRVEPNDFLGGQLAARALTDAGHRRILFLNGGVGAWTAVERERGFRTVMSEYGEGGIDFRVDYGDFEISSGYARMRAFIDRGTWMPTGVFAINDRVALGVLQALTEFGLKVPDDVSIVGYDDQPFLAAYLHPPLTTVLLPHHEMGRIGALALLEDPGNPIAPGARLAHPKLIVRDSVRRASTR